MLPALRDYYQRVHAPTLPAPAYVISDAHLGFATGDIERSLIRFVRHLHGRAGSLVINGDLFEFWFEWRSVMPRVGFRVLAALADLRESGVPILMVAGNHDCWGGEILRDDVGIDFRLDPWEGSLGGWRTRVEHGDGLRGKEDRGYRALRRVLRNPLAIRAFRLLHPDWGSALANRSSHTSRTYQARDGGAGLRNVATDRLSQGDGLELLIHGHSHVSELLRLGAGVYANAGSWLDAPTFLTVVPERIRLQRWDAASGEGVDLDSLDRVTQKTLP
ncbi:MAG TPA: UDP-2,3-diacylglucosamine diphosphatase [Gemmatimonadaceae bacterium]|nr:UDP-2,3-diacylglucosamine diphosphatase [Gemmatimonadaceae bacterium]